MKLIFSIIQPQRDFCKRLKSNFRWRHHSNPPYPPLSKGGNYEKLLVKSPFEKGGFRGI